MLGKKDKVRVSIGEKRKTRLMGLGSHKNMTVKPSAKLSVSWICMISYKDAVKGRKRFGNDTIATIKKGYQREKFVL